MKKRRDWRTLRANLSKLLNISPDILDFLSNYDIMLAGVSGLSVDDISKSMDIPISNIRNTLKTTIGKYCDNWDGFSTSSAINPYFVFKDLIRSSGSIPTEEDFSDEMQKLTGDVSFLGNSYKEIYGIILVFSTLRYKYLQKYRKEDYGNFISEHSTKITRL